MVNIQARQVAATALAALMVSNVEAFWRMTCESLGVARLDPLVNPGVPAPHAHSAHGASNFGLESTYESLLKSPSTSCQVKQDNSAYWTPTLYFQTPDGSSTLVPQVGGMIAYYLLYGSNIKAFPKGFKMIAGDSRQRNFTWPVPDPPLSSWNGDQQSPLALSQKALGFNCLNYGKAPEGSLDRHFLPNKAYLDANCTQGVRMELMFPSCWNGKDADSSDHRSHVAYPNLVKTGVCPPGYSTKLPTIFYETIWNTYAFKGKDGKFVLSNGDPTGFGYHGDFMTGWDVDFLQQAIDTCTDDSGRIEDCPLFVPNTQTKAEMVKAKIEIPAVLAQEDCKGPRQGLPGDVVIVPGPEYAPKPAGASKQETSPKKDGPSKQDAPTQPAVPSVSAVPSEVGSKTTTTAPSVADSATPIPSSIAPSSSTNRLGGIFAELPTGSAPAVAAQEVSSTEIPVTPAPTATPPPSKSFYSTIYSTSGTIVYEIFLVTEEVTVTVGTTATVTGSAAKMAKREKHIKRHQHGHAHAHVHAS